MVQSEEFKTMAPGWGSRLVAARKAIRKTQAEVGAALGVRNTAVSKWEAEQTMGIDERSLTAMEFTLGIRREWLVDGEEPMAVSSWNREQIRVMLNQVANARIDGVWVVPPGSGMAPLLGPGEMVFWCALEEPIQGAVIMATKKEDHAPEPGLAPTSTVVGQAFKAGNEWLLYRQEDRERPGSFPPIPLHKMVTIGRVVARVIPLADPPSSTSTT